MPTRRSDKFPQPKLHLGISDFSFEIIYLINGFFVHMSDDKSSGQTGIFEFTLLYISNFYAKFYIEVSFIIIPYASKLAPKTDTLSRTIECRHVYYVK